jgi:hypothetical protein
MQEQGGDEEEADEEECGLKNRSQLQIGKKQEDGRGHRVVTSSRW